MCRSGSESAGTTARRCECDTSEKRRLRRHNALTRQKYAELETPPTPIQKLTPVVSDSLTVEERAERANSLLEQLGGGLETWEQYQAIVEGDKAEETVDILTSVGEEVMLIAVEKYGAVKDEEWATKWEEHLDHIRTQRALNDQSYETHRELLRLEKEENPTVATLERIVALKEQRASLDEAGRQADSKVYETRMETLLSKQAEAYTRALKDIGVEYDGTLKLKIHPKSNKDAADVLEQAIKHYPAFFVERTLHSALLVGEATSRENPHYRSSYEIKEKTTYKTITSIYEVAPTAEAPINYADTPINIRDLGWVELPVELGYVKYEHEGSGHSTIMGIKNPDSTSAKTWWAKLPAEHKQQDKKPGGEGWTQATLTTGENVWWRTKTINKSRGGETVGYAPRIALPKHYSSVALPTAIHEFAHRVEDTSYFVKAAENAFLKVRAKGETQTHIPNSYRDAVGYRDHFTEHYVGRTYSDGSTEVLSTGMEAIFGGHMGGLMGVDQSNPDADAHHRNFVLGMLASSITLKKLASKKVGS